MANTGSIAAMKAEIDANIVPNNNAQLITGAKANATMKDMVDTLDALKANTSDLNGLREQISQKTELNVASSRSNVRQYSIATYENDTDYDILAFAVTAGERVAIVGKVDKRSIAGYVKSTIEISSSAWIETIYQNTESGEFNINYEGVVPVGATYVRISKKKTLDLKVYKVTGKFEGIESEIGRLEASLGETNVVVSQKLDKILGDNLINPDTCIKNKALRTNGEVADANGYRVSDFIPVYGKDIIANSWGSGTYWANCCVYNASRQFLRYIQSQQYTYQEGDAFVRFGFAYYSESSLRANYGTELLPYSRFTDYKPIGDVLKRMDKLEEYNLSPYTTIGIFPKMGVIGDSFSAAGIYDVEGVTSGQHLDICWGNLLCRKYGNTYFNYAKSAIDCSHWLTDTGIGAAKMESDAACNLYVIVLGINQEKLLSDPSSNAPIGEISDIKEDYTENEDTFYGHYGAIISRILAHAPKAKVILVKPTISSDTKNVAIEEIAELFGVPFIAMNDDPYYSTDFYLNHRSASHPIAVTYGGMANAFDRQITQCIVENIDYFYNYDPV